MSYHDKFFLSDSEMESFVDECDEGFRLNIKKISDDISQDKKVHFILLSVPHIPAKCVDADSFFREFIS